MKICWDGSLGHRSLVTLQNPLSFFSQQRLTSIFTCVTNLNMQQCYQHASCVLVNEEWRSSGRDGWTAGYPKGSEIFSLTVVSATSALLTTVNVSTLLSGHDNASNVTTSKKWAFYCVSIIFCVCLCVCVCTCVCVQRARHTKHIHMFQAQLKKQITRYDWAFSGSMVPYI